MTRKLKKTQVLEVLKTLADALELYNNYSNTLAIPRKPAKVKTLNGLEVKVYNSGCVEIELPRSPGVEIRLVDHNQGIAPKEAIYEIAVYRPRQKAKQVIGGGVYIGPGGIIETRI